MKDITFNHLFTHKVVDADTTPWPANTKRQILQVIAPVLAEQLGKKLVINFLQLDRRYKIIERTNSKKPLTNSKKPLTGLTLTRIFSSNKPADVADDIYYYYKDQVLHELLWRNFQNDKDTPIDFKRVESVIMTLVKNVVDRMAKSAFDDSLEEACAALINTSWQWKDSRGTFIKRLSNILYKEYNTSLDEKQINQIMYFVNHVKYNQDVYHYDFDRSYTWRAGDFHDGGSCFWSCRQGARDLMRKDHRFFALRIFKEIALREHQEAPNRNAYYKQTDKFYQGAARCWVAKERVNASANLSRIQGDHDIYILFNSYGKPLEEMAVLFKEHVNPNFGLRRVVANNTGNSGGTLYMNSNRVIIVGRPEIIDHIRYYDFSAFITTKDTFVDPSKYQPKGLIIFDHEAISSNITQVAREKNAQRISKEKHIFKKKPRPRIVKLKPQGDGILQYIPDQPFNVPDPVPMRRAFDRFMARMAEVEFIGG